MAEQISFKDLLGTGAHFGHVTRKWHPNYEPFILMERNGVHIINLEETVKHLNTALSFVKTIVQKNGEILFVGTKKQAKDIVQQEADRCGMFYIVERWLGGTLTNFSTIKKSIKRLKALEKEGSGIYDNLTKKEIQMLNRERLKLSDQHRGIKDMKRLPNAIVIIDVERELTALQEAIRLEIPVIALVDTNCDPRMVDYPIPANDDSIRTIQIILSAIVDTILEVKGENAISEEEMLDDQEQKDNEISVTEDEEKIINAELESAKQVDLEPKISQKSENLVIEKQFKKETAIKKSSKPITKKPSVTKTAKKHTVKTTTKKIVKESKKK